MSLEWELFVIVYLQMQCLSDHAGKICENIAVGADDLSLISDIGQSE